MARIRVAEPGLDPVMRGECLIQARHRHLLVPAAVPHARGVVEHQGPGRHAHMRRVGGVG